VGILEDVLFDLGSA
jgi:hypothetical protein